MNQMLRTGLQARCVLELYSNSQSTSPSPQITQIRSSKPFPSLPHEKIDSPSCKCPAPSTPAFPLFRLLCPDLTKRFACCGVSLCLGTTTTSSVAQSLSSSSSTCTRLGPMIMYYFCFYWGCLGGWIGMGRDTDVLEEDNIKEDSRLE